MLKYPIPTSPASVGVEADEREISSNNAACNAARALAGCLCSWSRLVYCACALFEDVEDVH